jgi:phage major head subunit gpT-like protein
MNVVLKLMKIAGLNTLFQAELEAYEAEWRESMTVVPSTRKAEQYGWLGDVPRLAEDKGEYIPEGLKEYDYLIKNRKFKAAMEIDDDDLADDQYGHLQQRVRNYVAAAGTWPYELLLELITGGESGLCYDGQPFFSTAHSAGSNLVTGTGAAVDKLQADLATARALAGTFKTDKGKLWPRVRPQWWVRCSSALYVPCLQAFRVTTVAAGGENVYAGLVAGVIEDSGLTGNSWYLEDRAPSVKGYIFQLRLQPTPKNTMPGSDQDVKHDSTLYTIRARGNGGYGEWRNVIKVKNT